MPFEFSKLSRLPISRRLFCAGLISQVACTPSVSRQSSSRYDGHVDNGIPIPAVNTHYIDRNMLRQEVAYDAAIEPNTLIVHTKERYLYHIHSFGLATRYGIGVGRAGFDWSGFGYIGRKAVWPTWTPTPAMIRRDPHLREMSFPMKPGLLNPLGARALYIYADGRDTLYRLHGTADPASIGQAVSSGCIRLLNQDVIHLFERTRIGTRILVK